MVTGIGICSPIGNSMGEVKDSIINNRSGIQIMKDWEKVDHLRTGIAGVCHNIDEKRIERKHRRSMGNVGILAALSALDAIEDAGIDRNIIASPLCGVSFGSTEGSTTSIEKFLTQINESHSLRGIPSSLYLEIMSHTCAANIAGMFGTKGPVLAPCAACVSGSQGIGFGYDLIKQGKASVMIAGGAEEMHFIHAGIFDLMKATSTRYNNSPGETPRPFDRDRDGLVVAEGSGCLILEELTHAKKRGASIHAEVTGFGTSCDGGHLTNPCDKGMASAMEIALKDAGLESDRIGHINAHATATEAGDIAESRAVYSLFGNRVPVTGFKGYMGHTLGGAGAIESIISILMMNDSFIPPTRNLENPDPRCAPIDHVMGGIRESSFDCAMNNNFAFGGINTSLIFTKI